MIIKNVVAITPVWNESLGMIQKFLNGISEVRKMLSDQGTGFRHFFLDDAAINLPDEYSILVRHKENRGLDQTLLDGYKKICMLKSKSDLVVRIDCQEHDSSKIPFVIDHISHSNTKAVFLPVWYWIEGQNRPLMKEITEMMSEFCNALSPIEKKVVLSIYNQKFPLGYQFFRTEFIEEILPQLERGLEIYKTQFNKPLRWGLDLLAILLAANKYPESVDFIFGGWSKPWLENRNQEKIEAQRKQAAEIIDIAIKLGCK